VKFPEFVDDGVQEGVQNEKEENQDGDGPLGDQVFAVLVSFRGQDVVNGVVLDA